MVQIQLQQPGQMRTRHQRSPSFPVQGGIKPFGLYPLGFTPVLPGETLDKLSAKMTYVSSPVKNPLAGGWLETWVYYVKLTDIDPDLGAMFIGQLTNSAAYQAPVDRPRYFTKSGQVDWLYLATQVVHKMDFLDEGETPRFVDGVPQLKRISTDFMESAVLKSDYENVATATTVEDMTVEMQAFLAMRQMGMGEVSYEQYLRTYGVKSVNMREGQPELLSYRRYWSLPSNVLDPTSGAPTGAFYWRLDDLDLKKPKLFKEPGFVIIYHAMRPKLFDGKQVASRSSDLWGFKDFFPSYTMSDITAGIQEMDPDTMKTFAGAGTAPYDPVWVDHRDLLMHGEQFINARGRFAPPLSTGRNFSASATRQDLRGQYAKLPADTISLFQSAVEDQHVIDYEGIFSTSIKGHVQDNT